MSSLIWLRQAFNSQQKQKGMGICNSKSNESELSLYYDQAASTSESNVHIIQKYLNEIQYQHVSMKLYILQQLHHNTSFTCYPFLLYFLKKYNINNLRQQTLPLRAQLDQFYQQNYPKTDISCLVYTKLKKNIKLSIFKILINSSTQPFLNHSVLLHDNKWHQMNSRWHVQERHGRSGHLCPVSGVYHLRTHIFQSHG